jgi:hypothetical protein
VLLRGTPSHVCQEVRKTDWPAPPLAYGNALSAISRIVRVGLIEAAISHPVPDSVFGAQLAAAGLAMRRNVIKLGATTGLRFPLAERVSALIRLFPAVASTEPPPFSIDGFALGNNYQLAKSAADQINKSWHGVKAQLSVLRLRQ